MENLWQQQPAFLLWTDPLTGLKCLLFRHPSLHHLCGYVRLPRRIKPGKRIGATARLLRKLERKLEVHGGVTFVGFLCRPSRAPLRGRWVGFDCAHYRDIVPALPYNEPGAVYRDAAFVRAECAHLAAQLSRF